jgi:hypothetical protein
MMALNGGGSASSRPQAVTTAAPTSPVPAASATPAPAAPSLSAAAPTPTTPTTTTPLISAVQAPVDAGQLQSFSLFESKDPFNASGPSTSHGGSSSSSGGGGGTSTTPKAPPAPPTPPPTDAPISVNGVVEEVSSGSDFPTSNPIFQLVSLTAKSAKVSVVGGSYSNGSTVLTLNVNKAVTLVNTADGTRYTLELLPQGTAVTSPPSSSSAAPATTTTPVAGG